MPEKKNELGKISMCLKYPLNPVNVTCLEIFGIKYNPKPHQVIRNFHTALSISFFYTHEINLSTGSSTCADYDARAYWQTLNKVQ